MIYDLYTEQALGYSDSHIGGGAEPAGYTWHSIVPTMWKVSNGAAYQLVVAVYSDECTPPPNSDTCIFHADARINSKYLSTK
jgi:hypothetical protein